MNQILPGFHDCAFAFGKSYYSSLSDLRCLNFPRWISLHEAGRRSLSWHWSSGYPKTVDIVALSLPLLNTVKQMHQKHMDGMRLTTGLPNGIHHLVSELEALDVSYNGLGRLILAGGENEELSPHLGQRVIDMRVVLIDLPVSVGDRDLKRPILKSSPLNGKHVSEDYQEMVIHQTCCEYSRCS